MSTDSVWQRQAEVVTHGRYDEQYKITEPESLTQNNAHQYTPNEALISAFKAGFEG